MSEKSWRNTTYAFPFDDGEAVCTGMTLRDYFAGQALVGIVNVFGPIKDAEVKTMAKASYEYADAMLEARK